MMIVDSMNSEVIDKINKIQKKIQIEEDKKKDIELNIDIFNKYLLSQIHCLSSPILPTTLQTVWFNFRKKEKDEKYKSCYKYLNDVIVDDIIADTKCTFKKTKVIDDITAEGYSGYAYQICFIANDIKFTLTIPDIKAIQLDNMVYTNYGQYRLGYYSSKVCNSYIIYSYNFDDLRQAFKEFIESRNTEVIK